MKRASIEPNFHTLYSQFLVVLKSEDLYDRVVKETYKNIGILLRADKSMANFSDRSLLKNLGHWLGLMLLARNKPILMVDLDMKHLIIEAFHNGQQEKHRSCSMLFRLSRRFLSLPPSRRCSSHLAPG